MESINLQKMALQHAAELLSEVKLANALVAEGKEVACDRRLQGVRQRILNFMEVLKRIPDDINVAQEAFEEQPAPQTE